METGGLTAQFFARRTLLHQTRLAAAALTKRRRARPDESVADWTPAIVRLIGLYGRMWVKRLGRLDYKIEKQLFISMKSLQD